MAARRRVLIGATGVALAVLAACGSTAPTSTAGWLARHGSAYGGLVSTAEDLALFARALFGGELFDDDTTLATMLEPGPHRGYGLGVELRRTTAGHTGALAGYHAVLRHDLDRDVTVVVLSNETPGPRPLATQAAVTLENVLARDDPAR